MSKNLTKAQMADELVALRLKTSTDQVTIETLRSQIAALAADNEALSAENSALKDAAPAQPVRNIARTDASIVFVPRAPDPEWRRAVDARAAQMAAARELAMRTKTKVKVSF